MNAYTLAEYESFMRKEEQEEKREMMREVRGMVKRSCKEVQAGRLGKQQEAKRQVHITCNQASGGGCHKGRTGGYRPQGHE